MNFSKTAFIVSLSFHLFAVWVLLNHLAGQANQSAAIPTGELEVSIYAVPGVSNRGSAPPATPAPAQVMADRLSDVSAAREKSVQTANPAAGQRIAPDPKITLADTPESAAMLGNGEIFYYADALDRTAEELISPVFDFSQLPADVEGHVTLELYVNSRGVVVGVHVLSSQPSMQFADAAVAGFRTVAYAPALRAGEAVASIKIIEMTVLDGIESAQAGMQFN